MYDCIIIGAGPAGLSAALYALRGNLKVLLLESTSYGGQILNSYRVDNYPGIKSMSGLEFSNILYEQVKELGVVYKNETVLSISKDLNVKTKKNTYKAKAIIIATGLENKKMGLLNEEKYEGMGISYCATCDGNFYKDKIVAVVGGGNTALEEAIYLSKIAKKVYLIHKRDSFRAFPNYVESVNNIDNIDVLLNTKITSLNGKDVLESINIDTCNDKKKLNISCLFVAVGKKPANDILKGLIELNEEGYVISKDGIHTNVDHIYVAGDTREKELRQLVTAASDGANAATTMIKELM